MVDFDSYAAILSFDLRYSIPQFPFLFYYKNRKEVVSFRKKGLCVTRYGGDRTIVGSLPSLSSRENPPARSPFRLLQSLHPMLCRKAACVGVLVPENSGKLVLRPHQQLRTSCGVRGLIEKHPFVVSLLPGATAMVYVPPVMKQSSISLSLAPLGKPDRT